MQTITVAAMGDVTWYVALPFIATEDGSAPAAGQECPNAITAVLRAESLSRKEGYVGAVAFSRSGDPSSGTFDEAKVLKMFGDVPADLSGL